MFLLRNRESKSFFQTSSVMAVPVKAVKSLAPDCFSLLSELEAHHWEKIKEQNFHNLHSALARYLIQSPVFSLTYINTGCFSCVSCDGCSLAFFILKQCLRLIKEKNDYLSVCMSLSSTTIQLQTPFHPLSLTHTHTHTRTYTRAHKDTQRHSQRCT